MKNLNEAFRDYNELKRIHENVYKEMKEKIEVVLSEIYEADNTLSFSSIYLGSYATRTGVNYNSNEYDIDTGIRLNIKSNLISQHSASTEKTRVYDAIKKLRKKNYRTMCLSASYYENDKPKYHIDFPVYAFDQEKDIYYLAVGKKDNVEWEKCEPQKLIEYLKYTNAEQQVKESYLKTIRFLKLWKDKVFSSMPKDSCPPSIAINLSARSYFQSDYSNNDIDNLISVVDILLSHINDSAMLNIPFAPFSNVYYKMNNSNEYVEIYKENLEHLKVKLQEAKEISSTSLEEACKILSTIFPDFPIPKKQRANESFSPSGSYGK